MQSRADWLWAARADAMRDFCVDDASVGVACVVAVAAPARQPDQGRTHARQPRPGGRRAERTLASRGQATEVLAMRRAFQDTMREDLIATVETLTGRTVEAFLSNNLHDPDVAVEVFLMNLSDGNGQPPPRGSTRDIPPAGVSWSTRAGSVRRRSA